MQPFSPPREAPWYCSALGSSETGLAFPVTYRLRGRHPRGGRPGCPRRPTPEPRPLGGDHMLRLQAPLPDRYTLATADELDRWIAAAKNELGDRLLVLGHHYQRDEVIKWADARGDSFKLARFAADNDQATDVVFCGVHAMAESADVLTGPVHRVAA